MRLGKLLLPVLVALVAALVLLVIDLPGHSKLWRAMSNAGHVPLFGLVAILLLYGLASRWPRGAPGRARAYGWSFALTAGLGALTEWIQYWGPRDADLGDLLLDAVGAAGFLVIHATSRYTLFPAVGRPSRGRRALLRYGALALLAASLSPPAFWSVVFIKRNSAVPVLFASDSFWLRSLVLLQDAEWARGSDPTLPRGARTLRFLVGPYPGMVIEDIYPDWSGYDSLVLELWAGAEAPPELGLRIDDRRHTGDHTDRFNTRITVSPGANRFAVGLDQIRASPRGRPMDTDQIAALFLYVGSASSGSSLAIQAIRLRRSPQ